MFSSSLALLSMLSPLLAVAQYGDAPAPAPEYSSSSSAAAVASTTMLTSGMVTSTTTSASGAAATSTGTLHKVSVGLGGLVFNPNNLTAAVGDRIEFTYHPRNHSVSQSTFATPCFHSVDASNNANGLDSGFVPVGASDTSFPTFTITVAQTTPLWFYCAQGTHCLNGMIFAVNAPTTGRTVDAFIANAKNASAVPAANAAPIAATLRTSAAGGSATGVASAASGGTATGSAATATGTTSKASSAAHTALACGAMSMAALAAAFAFVLV